jgi:hypothetical protein
MSSRNTDNSDFEKLMEKKSHGFFSRIFGANTPSWIPFIADLLLPLGIGMVSQEGGRIVKQAAYKKLTTMGKNPDIADQWSSYAEKAWRYSTPLLLIAPDALERAIKSAKHGNAINSAYHEVIVAKNKMARGPLAFLQSDLEMVQHEAKLYKNHLWNDVKQNGAEAFTTIPLMVSTFLDEKKDIIDGDYTTYFQDADGSNLRPYKQEVNVYKDKNGNEFTPRKKKGGVFVDDAGNPLEPYKKQGEIYFKTTGRREYDFLGDNGLPKPADLNQKKLFGELTSEHELLREKAANLIGKAKDNKPLNTAYEVAIKAARKGGLHFGQLNEYAKDPGEFIDDAKSALSFLSMGGGAAKNLTQNWFDAKSEAKLHQLCAGKMTKLLNQFILEEGASKTVNLEGKSPNTRTVAHYVADIIRQHAKDKGHVLPDKVQSAVRQASEQIAEAITDPTRQLNPMAMAILVDKKYGIINYRKSANGKLTATGGKSHCGVAG